MTRTFAAAQEKVFQAWTQPENFFFSVRRTTERHSTRVVELDLRVGGKYRIEITSPEGQVHRLFGIYREVQPPERLVFTWSWEESPDFGETLVRVEFRRLGQSMFTEVVLTHELFPNQKARDDHNQGWNGCLDTLAEFLKESA